MDYLIKRQAGFLACEDIEKEVFVRYIGKGGRIWLVGVTEPSNNIYVDGCPGSQGFGGSTLTFKMVDGSEVQLKGPWHSNSEALFYETGVDVRGLHKTFVVIS